MPIAVAPVSQVEVAAARCREDERGSGVVAMGSIGGSGGCGKRDGADRCFGLSDELLQTLSFGVGTSDRDRSRPNVDVAVLERDPLLWPHPRCHTKRIALAHSPISTATRSSSSRFENGRTSPRPVLARPDRVADGVVASGLGEEQAKHAADLPPRTRCVQPCDPHIHVSRGYRVDRN